MQTIALPRGLACFCSMDWGHHAPGVTLWWLEVGDGHWHIARELKHTGINAEDFVNGYEGFQGYTSICRELGVKPMGVVADPNIWSKLGVGYGESVAETLIRHRLPMVKADNDRRNGWYRCHEILRLAPDGRPWVTVDARCTYGRRSLPALQSDPNDPDDVKSADDHWGDAFRYGAMSRFLTVSSSRRRVEPPKPWTMGWFKAQQQQAETVGVLGRR